MVEAFNYSVQVFDNDGHFLTAFGTYGTDEGEFAVPAGITVDGAGNVYVSDASLDRVTTFRLRPGMAAPAAGTPVP